MRHLLLYLFFIPAIINSSEPDKIKSEITNLISAYNNYLIQIKTTPNQYKINNLDKNLQKYILSSEVITFPNNHTFQIPLLEYFNYVKPDGKLNVTEKTNLIATDIIKLENTLFLLPLLSELYKNPNLTSKNYATFMYEVESKLLDIAKQSLTEKDPDKYYALTIQYGLLIQELSSLQFPDKYAFYRRRRLFSIDPPEAAHDEIKRLEESIQNLSKEF